VVVEPQATNENADSPSAVCQSNPRAGSFGNLGQTDENRSCSCWSNNCTVCMSMSGNECSMHGNGFDRQGNFARFCLLRNLLQTFFTLQSI
jgi:hypothetical protein